MWSADDQGNLILNAKPSVPVARPHEHRTRPGAVLFRDPSKKKLVVLLLVGETPTRGLQKEAFAEALTAIAAYGEKHPESAPGKSRPLRILGPYFSGSAESLRIALGSHLGSQVKILSGSATSDSNRNILAGFEFRAATRPDSEMMGALNNYFNQIHVDPATDVALLVEEGTAYAQDVAERETPRLKLLMRFPLQISQIRGAYEKREAAKRGTSVTPQPHRALEISLEGPEGTRDALPPYESRMTASAAELVLGNVLDTVRRQQVRYLGLVASDTRDILFLARKAREFGSDANLFTFGADILYQHPDALSSLDGLLVVTTYPLLVANQAWHSAPENPRRRSFAGSSEEGIYNAMLFLIDRDDLVLDYASPNREDVEQPPVWIVANGRNGFWPVRVFSDSSDYLPSKSQKDSTPLPHEWPGLPLPPAMLVLFVAWSGGSALLIVFHKRYRRPDSELPSELAGPASLRDRFRTFFGLCSGESHVFMNHGAMASLFLVNAVIEGFLAVQILRWDWIGYRKQPEKIALLAIAAVGVGLACLGLNTSLVEVRALLHAKVTPSPGRSGAASSRRTYVFTLAEFSLLVLFGILVAIFCVSCLGWSSEDPFLLLNRSFNLGSRTGPLLPLCLAGLVLALLGNCQVRRSVLYEEQRFSPPENQPPQTLLALLEPYTAFTELVSNSFASPITSAAPLIGMLVFHGLFVGPDWYRSFDGRPWNALSTVLFSLCGWCVAWAVLEFREIWRRLSALLRRLSWSPLADAFNRMPDGLAKSQWRMWRTPPTLTSLYVSVSLLKTLVSLGKDPQLENLLDKEVKDAYAQADCIFTQVLNGANKGYATTHAQRKALRTELARATLGVCSMLEKEWGAWPSKADIKDKSEKEQETLNTVVWLRRQVPKPPDVFVRIAEEYVAVRFVAFIHYAFSHMRNMLSFALVSFVLLMAIVGSYPFQPFHPVVGMAWVLGLLGIAGIVWTFIDMDRDVILSYIAKTRPGRVEVNFELATNLFVYAVIPLLTLLATQFPQLGDWILSFLNPAMKVR